MEESHRAGRPTDASITAELINAARQVMENQGYSGLSVEALTRVIGTTRPTFYRRFPSIAHLAFEVIGNTFGTGEPVATGSLRDDLLELQRQDMKMFDSRLMRNNFPGLLETIRTDASVRARYESEFVGARRNNVQRVLDAAVERGELRGEGFDTDLVCDLLVGPLLSRALLPVSAPLDERLVALTVDAVLGVLDRTGSVA
jgi:AcrR family transcriptional regulator